MLLLNRIAAGVAGILLGFPAGMVLGDERPSLNKSLLLSVREGNAARVAEQLEQGANPNATEEGQSALHIAALRGNCRILKLLIAKGARLDAREGSGRTPLVEAVGHHDPEATKILLAAGAPPDARAFAQACWLDRREAVQLLLAAGAKPDDGLPSAAQGGHVELVRRLLQKGANVNARSREGNTGLHMGALQGGIDVVALLVEAGADPNLVNDEGKTPLQIAITGNRDVRVVNKLIAAGARADFPPDKDGITPLRRAAMHNHALYQVLLAAAGGVERPVRPAMPDSHREKAINELIQDLTANDYMTQVLAMRALRAHGPAAIPEIVKQIESGNVATFWAHLGCMGPDAEPVLPALAARLGDTENVYFAMALMEQIKPGSFKQLPVASRSKAAMALHDRIVMCSDEDLWPNHLVHSLASLGDVATPFVLKLMRSAIPLHRVAGAHAVTPHLVRDNAVRAELLKIVTTDTHLPARSEAIGKLGLLETLHAEERKSLLAALKDKELGQVAAWSLVRAGPEIIDDLLPLITPIDAPHRSAAIKTLEALGDAAVPRLSKLLRHRDRAVAITASVVLSRGSLAAAFPALRDALKSEDEQVVELAASALWWMGPRARLALPVLLEVVASKERSDGSRLVAACAAVRIDPEETLGSQVIRSLVPMLIRILESGQFREQGEAAELLGQIGPAARDALPSLRKRLTPPDRNVETGGLIPSYVQDRAGQAIKLISGNGE